MLWYCIQYSQSHPCNHSYMCLRPFCIYVNPSLANLHLWFVCILYVFSQKHFCILLLTTSFIHVKLSCSPHLPRYALSQQHSTLMKRSGTHMALCIRRLPRRTIPCSRPSFMWWITGVGLYKRVTWASAPTVVWLCPHPSYARCLPRLRGMSAPQRACSRALCVCSSAILSSGLTKSTWWHGACFYLCLRDQSKYNFTVRRTGYVTWWQCMFTVVLLWV